MKHHALCHLFIKNLPFAAAILDRNLNYLLFTQRWLSDLGLEQQEIVGRSHAEVFPQDDELLRAAYKRCMTEAIELSVEEPFQRTDGSTGWRKWDIRPWRDGTDEIGGIMLTTEDISDRKRAEEGFAVNEARLRHTAANLPGVIFQFTNRNEAWTVDYMSEGIWKLTGTTAEAVMEDVGAFIRHVHPEDLESYYASVVQAVEQSTPWHYEGRLIESNGSVRWWQGNSVPTKNQQGETIFCGVLLDITDRKEAEGALRRAKAELELRVEDRTREWQQTVTRLQNEIQEREQAKAALRESEAELQSIIDNCSAVVYLKDIEGRLIRVNREFERLFNITEEQVKGKTDYDLFPKEIADQFRQNDRQILVQGKAIISEEVAPHEDGLHTYVSVKFPIFNAQGEPYALGGISTDISDRKRTEEQLRKERDFNQKLIQTSPAFFVTIRGDGTVMSMNDAMLKAVGYTIDEAIGKDYNDNFVPERDRTSVADGFKQLSETGQINIRENHILTKAGKELLVEWHGTPIYQEDGSFDYFFGVGIDITERKRAEQERDRFFNLSADMLCIGGFDGYFKRLNPAWTNTLGYTQEELLAQPFLDFIHPDEREATLGEFNKIQDGVISLTFENRYRCKDGSYKWLSWCSVPLVQEGLSYATARDITASKEMAEQLRQSEKRYQTLAEASPICVFYTDTQGSCTYANQRWTEIAGRPSAKALGYDWIEALHPEDRDRLLAEWQAASKLRQHFKSECRFVRPDGTVVWLIAQASIIEEENGELIGYVGTLTDITERKQAEAALQERNAILRSILESTPDFIFVKDREGRHVALNSNLANFFSKAIEDILGKDDAELLPPDVAREIMAKDHQIIKSGISETYEEVVSNGHSNSTFLTTKAPWRDAHGNILGIVTLTRDITDRKQAEEALQQSEAQLKEKARQLEQTLRELQQTQAQLVQTEKMSGLGQLVAGVAHEINNPVNFIYGNLTHADEYMRELLRLLELYQKHYPTPDPSIEDEAEAIDLEFLMQDFPKLLSSMKVGAERIQKIVLALRNFSRMDEAQVKSVNIHEGIDSTLMILHNRLKDKPDCCGIEVIKEYGNLPAVECYAGQLNQVFMNLLSNAIDALQERDNQRSPQDIKHSPSQITICTQVLNKQYVRVRIADNGLGMTESVRRRLFEPFFTTKPVGKGTGLGLSISYQVVVERHGGALQCISAPGEGAEFIVDIPIKSYQI